MFAEKDDMTGVSENIMLGQLAPLGTGAFELLLDDTKLEDAIEVQYAGAELDYFGGAMTPGRMTPGRSPHRTPSHMSPSCEFHCPLLMSLVLAFCRLVIS